MIGLIQAQVFPCQDAIVARIVGENMTRVNVTGNFSG